MSLAFSSHRGTDVRDLDDFTAIGMLFMWLLMGAMVAVEFIRFMLTIRFNF